MRPLFSSLESLCELSVPLFWAQPWCVNFLLVSESHEIPFTLTFAFQIFGIASALVFSPTLLSCVRL